MHVSNIRAVWHVFLTRTGSISKIGQNHQNGHTSKKSKFSEAIKKSDPSFFCPRQEIDPGHAQDQPL